MAATIVALAIGACTDTSVPEQSEAAADFQKELQLRLINAQAGDVIDIPALTDKKAHVFCSLDWLAFSEFVHHTLPLWK